jgi:hypothetical protein
MAKTKAAKKATGGKEMLGVASKVKSFIRGKGLTTSSEAIGALNAKVNALLDAVAERTKANRRNSNKGQDL